MEPILTLPSAADPAAAAGGGATAPAPGFRSALDAAVGATASTGGDPGGTTTTSDAPASLAALLGDAVTTALDDVALAADDTRTDGEVPAEEPGDEVPAAADPDGVVVGAPVAATVAAAAAGVAAPDDTTAGATTGVVDADDDGSLEASLESPLDASLDGTGTPTDGPDETAGGSTDDVVAPEAPAAGPRGRRDGVSDRGVGADTDRPTGQVRAAQATAHAREVVASTPAATGPAAAVSVGLPGSLGAAGGDQDSAPSVTAPAAAGPPGAEAAADVHAAASAPASPGTGAAADRASGTDTAAAAAAAARPPASRPRGAEHAPSPPSGTGLGGLEAAQAAARHTVSDAGPGTPAEVPALVAQRVARSAEALRHQPPPRSMTLELGDLEGLRLHVSLRAGVVHVTALSGDPDALRQLPGDLATELRQRGFELGSFAKRDGERSGTGREADDRRRRSQDPFRFPDPAVPAAGRPTDDRAGLRL